MATFNIDSSSISNLIVSKSFIVTSSIQFVTNSLSINYGLGQGGGVNFNSFNTSSESHAEGFNNTASARYSHLEGSNNYTIFENSNTGHIEGLQNYAYSAVLTHIEGFNNTGSIAASSTPYAHTEGEGNYNNRGATHVEGYKNSSGNHQIQNWGHIEGYNNIFTRNFQYYFHIEGEANRGPLDSSGTFRTAHIEGYGNQCALANQYSNHIEGSGSYSPIVPSGQNFGAYDGSHIEGGGHNLTLPDINILGVNTKWAHIEGFNNSAKNLYFSSPSQIESALYCHVEGYNNSLTGSYGGSWITGIDNIINAFPSSSGTPITRSFFQVQAIGRGLKLYNTASQYATFLGHYNTSLLTGSSYTPGGNGYTIIGGGKNDSNRANILEIYETQPNFTGTYSYIVLPGIQSFSGNQAAINGGVPIGGLYALGGVLSIVTGSS